jgi:hypothetical protein
MFAVAVDSIAKERLFKHVQTETGEQMDLFVVNTFCTVSQVCCPVAVTEIHSS